MEGHEGSDFASLHMCSEQIGALDGREHQVTLEYASQRGRHSSVCVLQPVTVERGSELLVPHGIVPRNYAFELTLIESAASHPWIVSGDVLS